MNLLSRVLTLALLTAALSGCVAYRPLRACPPGYHLGPYGQRCWLN